MRKFIITLAISLVAAVGLSQDAGALSFTDTLLLNKPATVATKPAPKKEVKKTQTKPVVSTPKVVTYVVQEGDTLTGIADKTNISWVRLWQKNTQLTNQDSLAVNDTLTLPADTETLAERPFTGPVSDSSPIVVSQVTPTPTSSYRASSEPNAYDYGYCTWYVKNKRPDVGGYWGNASNWLSSAIANGFSTGVEPRAGAVGVNTSMAGGLGHVVYVESLNGDGTINLSDMNYNGWGVTSYRTAPASDYTYIY